MNQNIKQTELREFKNDLKDSISSSELDEVDFESKNKNRAFIWKGSAPLKRNLGILKDTSVDNIRE
jgi:hypothetical protein